MKKMEYKGLFIFAVSLKAHSQHTVNNYRHNFRGLERIYAFQPAWWLFVTVKVLTLDKLDIQIQYFVVCDDDISRWKEHFQIAI